MLPIYLNKPVKHVVPAIANDCFYSPKPLCSFFFSFSELDLLFMEVTY